MVVRWSLTCSFRKISISNIALEKGLIKNAIESVLNSICKTSTLEKIDQDGGFILTKYEIFIKRFNHSLKCDTTIVSIVETMYLFV